MDQAPRASASNDLRRSGHQPRITEARSSAPLREQVARRQSHDNLIDSYVAQVFEALPDLLGVALIDVTTALVVSQRTRASVNWSAFAVSARLILEGFIEINRISFAPIREEMTTVQVATNEALYFLKQMAPRFSLLAKFPLLEGADRALSMAELQQQIDDFKSSELYAPLRGPLPDDLTSSEAPSDWRA